MINYDWIAENNNDIFFTAFWQNLCKSQNDAYTFILLLDLAGIDTLIVWIRNTGKRFCFYFILFYFILFLFLFLKLISISNRSICANSVRMFFFFFFFFFFFWKKQLTFWSVVQVSLPCMLAKQKMICRHRQSFFRHLLCFEAYTFVNKPSCDAKFCRIVVAWLQIYTMQEEIPDFVHGKYDPCWKRVKVKISKTFFLDNLTSAYATVNLNQITAAVSSNIK